MSSTDIALMAHLMRRAGFGATRDELERYVDVGYEAMVERLLHPEEAPPAIDDDDILRRYHVGMNSFFAPAPTQAHWVYRMVHTRRPLEEKISLFWHGVFATGYTKLSQPRVIANQIDMFRFHGLASFHTLLLELSRDPAMIFWLDNKDNHKDGYNENYGRELLELFAMGVGNYTEQDVYEVSRAFTGWSIRNPSLHTARAEQMNVEPYGRQDYQFEYVDGDHDDSEKTFLGHTGHFNGEDIIDIVCRQPATARFLSRHLYNFFVADEPQVPAWNTVPPRDPDAVQALMDAYFEHGYQVRSMLRTLFNSDFFKDAAFQKVKSPAEMVAGAARLSGGLRFPEVDDELIGGQPGIMGQSLGDPPSVEGWHTGVEWITTGSLVERVNFAAGQFDNADKPGVRSIVDRVRARGERVSADALVDTCLDLMGPLQVSQRTRSELLAYTERGGDVRFGTPDEDRAAARRVTETLQLIVATREYQLG
ncbi:MAG: DUF1800 domain-containing protein [Dehalococcoidia bacterium]|nr:DUF1800 domain-containing protein [Dehalococcoidia bacterium]